MTDRAKNDQEPIVAFYLGPNKPCYDGDEPYFKKRSSLDKTFTQVNDCDSTYKGNKQNKEYIETGLMVNEYDLLGENGVLDELLDKDRRRGDYYDDDAHKKYNYNLYLKRYSPYKTSCHK